MSYPSTEKLFSLIVQPTRTIEFLIKCTNYLEQSRKIWEQKTSVQHVHWRLQFVNSFIPSQEKCHFPKTISLHTKEKTERWEKCYFNWLKSIGICKNSWISNEETHFIKLFTPIRMLANRQNQEQREHHPTTGSGTKIKLLIYLRGLPVNRTADLDTKRQLDWWRSTRVRVVESNQHDVRLNVHTCATKTWIRYLFSYHSYLYLYRMTGNQFALLMSRTDFKKLSSNFFFSSTDHTHV